MSLSLMPPEMKQTLAENEWHAFNSTGRMLRYQQDHQFDFQRIDSHRDKMATKCIKCKWFME